MNRPSDLAKVQTEEIEGLFPEMQAKHPGKTMIFKFGDYYQIFGNGPDIKKIALLMNAVYLPVIKGRIGGHDFSCVVFVYYQLKKWYQTLTENGYECTIIEDFF